jgi:DNA-damage-inducible protein J
MSTSKDTETIQIRVNPELKENVEKIFEKLGMSTSQAIKVFLAQVAMEKAIPFPLVVNEPEIEYITEEEEEELKKAYDDFKNGRYITVRNKEELRKYLDSL